MDHDASSYIQVAAIAVVLTIVLTAAVLVHYGQIAKKPGKILIPAGNTYLGPNTPNTLNSPSTLNSPNSPTQFTVSADTAWQDIHGKIFPYTFSAPVTLKLVTFGDNPYDIYAISWNNIDPGSAVLVGVDDLKAHEDRSQYITEPKISYVRNWWKQFTPGLKGVASVDEFTNPKGLKGYKVKYFNAAGETPNIDIFFEVPKQPQYVIHLANGILDPAVFDKIVDSVAWETK